MAPSETHDDAVDPREHDSGARRRWRCPPEVLGPDGQPDEAWRERAMFQWYLLSLKLGRVLRGMRPGDRLILTDAVTGDYVQFARETGWFAEARSNQYIEGFGEPLTAIDMGALRHLGWRAPVLDARALARHGAPLAAPYTTNWWRRAPIRETEALATVACATLAWVYRTGVPETLRVSAFAMRGGAPPDVEELCLPLDGADGDAHGDGD